MVACVASSLILHESHQTLVPFQICEHLKAAAKWTNIRVVPIVGGIAAQKQQRLLKQMPEIVVGTPGRLWELMTGGESHLLEVWIRYALTILSSWQLPFFSGFTGLGMLAGILVGSWCMK